MPQRRRVGPAQLMFHLCLMSVAFGTHGHLVQKDEALYLSNWATINSGAYEEPRPAQLDTSCKAKAIAPEAAKIVRATEAVCHCEWSKFEPFCRQVEVFGARTAGDLARVCGEQSICIVLPLCTLCGPDEHPLSLPLVTRFPQTRLSRWTHP